MTINAIPNNMEKCMAVMLGRNLVFIDSFQFLSQSLENLKYTSEIFQAKALDLMSQKGVYPYDSMDRFEKFNDTKLPSKEQLFSQLNNEQIADDD